MPKDRVDSMDVNLLVYGYLVSVCSRVAEKLRFFSIFRSEYMCRMRLLRKDLTARSGQPRSRP